MTYMCFYWGLRFNVSVFEGWVSLISRLCQSQSNILKCTNFILFACFRHANGSTLVICSEGNAGFYEIGIMVTPLEAGYSVLGWNHPGFGGSTVWYISLSYCKSREVSIHTSEDLLTVCPYIIRIFCWNSDNALDSYSGIAWFKSCPGHRPSWLYFFMVFFSPLIMPLPFASKCSPVHNSSILLFSVV